MLLQRTRPGSRQRSKRRLTPSLLVLSLMILLPTWQTASADEPTVAAVDSVTVSKQLLIDARETIDELEYELAVSDSMLAAQKDYYLELLSLKDRRIEILENTVKDALGNETMGLVEKLVWGFAGYGLGRAVE
jgi:hypothetical protein